MTPFTKILVAHDFSEHAKHAVAIAIDLARRYDASLSIVHVLQPLPYAIPDAFPMYQQPALLNEAQKLLDKVEVEAIEVGTRKLTVDLLHGSPVQEITEYARSGQHDLIVMGSAGRTGIAHLLLGSVAERVVRTAPCAVLTVRSPAKRPDA